MDIMKQGKIRTKYSLKGIYEGHYKITYRGIPCLKCPFDYVMYQMIIFEVQPDLIIEIGTNEGGSAFYRADLLNILGKGVIHTIDIEDKVSELPKAHPRIKFFTSGWADYDLRLAKGFEKVLVIEDSSHNYQNTLGAIKRFAELVTKDSYLIVEDGIIDELGLSKSFGGGPLKAIKEFLPQHREFRLETKWSDLFGPSATFNTGGYLKKIQ